MKQEVAVTEKNSETSIRRIVSDRFFKMVKSAIDEGLVKNEREFAMRIGEGQAEFSKIKSPNNNRYIDVEMLYKAANAIGINANRVLADDGEKTEPLIREHIQIKGGNVKGNNNVVLTGQAVSQNGDVYLNVEKLTQSLPDKARKEILKKFANLESQNTRLSDEMEDLKKTIDRYEREIEKDKKIIQTQEKLIEMMEKAKTRKK